MSSGPGDGPRLRVVDPNPAEAPNATERSATPGGAEPKETAKGRLVGALVAALLVTLLVAGLQWQAASKLEVQVASLETELAESQLEVRAHEARMSEVRGAVSGLAQRVEHLQTLVRRPLPKGP